MTSSGATSGLTSRRVTKVTLHAPESQGDLRFGAAAAWATTGLTVLSFGLALTALPDHVPYPFAGEHIAAQWPGDYWWMYAAMLLMVAFVALVAAVHRYARSDRQLYSLLALCAAVLACGVLLVDYFVQVTVMQPSLEKGQLEGWAMLTQYNPNGVFIALEELGYLLMALALLCLVPVFDGRNRVELALRVLFTACFVVSAGALGVVSAVRGIDRGDVFEVTVISVVWLVLIAAGPLVSAVLTRARRSPAPPEQVRSSADEGATS